MDVSLLVSSIGSALEVGKLLVNERDRQKAAALEVNLTEKLIQAQTQVSQVLAAIIDKDGRIHALAERARELESDQSERSRYQLAKLGTLGEFFAYQLRPAGELHERANEPTHFLCQPCFDGGKKSVLRLSSTHAVCSVCKLAAQIHSSPPPAPRRSAGIGTNW